MTFRKSDMKLAEVVYGNGAVYASDGRRVYGYLSANFSVHPELPESSLDIDMDKGEVIVAFESGTTKADAIRAIDLIKRRIEQIPEVDFNPDEWDIPASKRTIVGCWEEDARR